MRSFVFTAAAIACLSVAAHADTITYSSQSAFSAAATNVTTYSIPTLGTTGTNEGSKYQVGPVTFGGFFVFNYNDGYYGAGVPYAGVLALSTTVTTANFDALAFSVGTYESADIIDVLVNGGSAGSFSTLGTGTPTFFGVTSSTPITSLLFTSRNPIHNEVDFTQFETGSPAVTTSVTPEPSSLALLGTGVLGLAGMVRRRRV